MKKVIKTFVLASFFLSANAYSADESFETIQVRHAVKMALWYGALAEEVGPQKVKAQELKNKTEASVVQVDDSILVPLTKWSQF